MPGATFTCPDLTTFAHLDELGLEVLGQQLEPDRAVLAYHVVEQDQWCLRCGCEGSPPDTVIRRLAHEPLFTGFKTATDEELPDKQCQRLADLFGGNQHVGVGVTWGDLPAHDRCCRPAASDPDYTPDRGEPENPGLPACGFSHVRPVRRGESSPVIRGDRVSTTTVLYSAGSRPLR